MFNIVYLVFFGYLVIVSSFKIIDETSLGAESNVENNISDVCKTKECYTLSEFIKKGMNDTVNPCEDFYSYVCGSWPVNYPVPEDKFKWDLDSMVEEKINIILKGILQKRSRTEDSVLLSLEKKWFKSCMDEERINRKGLEPLRNIIEEIGGWPMAMNKSAWEKKEITWQNVAQYYANIVGGYSLFNIGIQPDSENSTRQIIAIDQPGDSLIETRTYGDKENSFHYKKFLSYNYNFDDNDDNDDDEDDDGKETDDAAVKYVSLILKIAFAYAASAGGSEKIILTDTINLLKFEVALKEIQTPPDKKADMELINNKMRISDFQKSYNRKKPGRFTARINWLEMIQALFNNTDIVIDELEEIAILDKPYIDKLVQLLKHTPQKTIVNFIHWSFISDVLKYLDETTRQWLSETVNTAMGVTKESERWEDCLNNMPIKDGMSIEFIKSQFPDMTKQTARDMAEEIRKEIDTEISRANWMNSETKSLARNKLKLMDVLIGYPEWYSSTTDLNDYYDGLQIGPDYFENAINYFKFITRNTIKIFREPFDKNQWLMSPITPNAYYLPPTNTLTVPAAQLLIPIFHANVPDALNYGSVGFIIGHEMSHGFDVTGRKYDGNGNVIPWWSNKMIREYEKKAKCFVDQFNNYNVDGKLTQGENIADTAGLNAAYGAYLQKIKKDKIKDQTLPGLENLDSNQLFFVSFSVAFCQSATQKFLAKVETDVHTKSSARINGAVANVKGFSEAFKCGKDKKCTLWS